MLLVSFVYGPRSVFYRVLSRFFYNAVQERIVDSSKDLSNAWPQYVLCCNIVVCKCPIQHSVFLRSKWASSPFLNVLRVSVFTTLFGIEFHSDTTLFVKKFSLTSSQVLYHSGQSSGHWIWWLLLVLLYVCLLWTWTLMGWHRSCCEGTPRLGSYLLSWR